MTFPWCAAFPLLYCVLYVYAFLPSTVFPFQPIRSRISSFWMVICTACPLYFDKHHHPVSSSHRSFVFPRRFLIGMIFWTSCFSHAAPPPRRHRRAPRGASRSSCRLPSTTMAPALLHHLLRAAPRLACCCCSSSMAATCCRLLCRAFPPIVLVRVSHRTFLILVFSGAGPPAYFLRRYRPAALCMYDSIPSTNPDLFPTAFALQRSGPACLLIVVRPVAAAAPFAASVQACLVLCHSSFLDSFQQAFLFAGWVSIGPTPAALPAAFLAEQQGVAHTRPHT